MEVSIERIVKQQSGRRKIELTGGERLHWPAPVVNCCDLEKGEAVEPRELREELTEKAREILPKRAREYLAAYSRTTEQYCQHFEQKGYPEELVQSLVASLREEGYLDDEQFARRHIRDRVENKPRGRRKIVAELRKKGIDRELASRLVESEVTDQEERQLARRYCRKNKGLSKRKLASRLESRGFPGSVIKEMLDEFAAGEKL